MVLPEFNKKRWILFLALCLYYLSFQLICGVIICGDSFFFQTGSVRVSPLYPALIGVFKALFTENGYEYPLVVFQELLMAYSVFSFTDCLEKQLKLKPIVRVMITVLIAFFLYAFRIILIGKDTDTVFCNAILSEGIAYPLYLLFAKYLFLGLTEKRSRYLLSASVFAFLLSAARGQLYWLVIPLVIAFAGIIRKCKSVKEKGRLWIGAILTGTAFFLCSLAFSRGYHFIRTGTVMNTTQGSETFLTTVLYDSKPKDLEGLDLGEKEYVVLKDTLSISEEEGWLSDAAPHDLIGRYRHYEDSFDRIRLLFLQKVANSYGYHDETDIPADLLSMSCNSCAMCIPRLAEQNLKGYFKTRAINFIAGLVRSNSIFNLPGIFWSFILYAAGVCTVLTIRKRDENMAVYMELCLMLSLCNSVFVSFGVFALSRYMYYNFPLYYSACFLLVKKLIEIVLRNIKLKEKCSILERSK